MAAIREVPRNIVLLTADNPGVLMKPTISVRVRAGPQSDTIRGVLSWDSEHTLITEECRRRFNLPLVTGETFSVDDLKGKGTGILGRSLIQFSPHNSLTKNMLLSVLVVERINETINSAVDYPMIKPHLTHLNLADPSFDEPGEVDLLTGLMVTPYLLRNGMILIPGTTCFSMDMELLDGSIIIPPLYKAGDRDVIGTGCHAQETVLGWVIEGRLPPVENMRQPPQSFTEQIDRRSEGSSGRCDV